MELWMFSLVNFIIYLIITGVVGALIGRGGATMLAGLYMLAILIPSIAVGARRLHDIGRTGWWLLVDFVPFVGPIVLLIFFVLPSQEGSNEYGANPL